MNAWVARVDGEPIIERHSETDESGTQHEELYLVTRGHATFQVAGETIEAPAGTFVYVRDPDVVREATGRSKGTTVLALGAARGEAFTPSEWELKHVRDDGELPSSERRRAATYGPSSRWLVELPTRKIDPETPVRTSRARRRDPARVSVRGDGLASRASR